MKIRMLINVKMPTVVGILTFISMINTTPEILKKEKIYILFSILAEPGPEVIKRF